jgi:hypothetical protein
MKWVLCNWKLIQTTRLVFFLFVYSLIPTWRKDEFLRWKRC